MVYGILSFIFCFASSLSLSLSLWENEAHLFSTSRAAPAMMTGRPTRAWFDVVAGVYSSVVAVIPYYMYDMLLTKFFLVSYFSSRYIN